ncbi:DNA alkylation repair protein [Flavobacterium sp. SUN046]|uniref:DNA alkylation repair protein n=1 Tax=Flavobacterium sp. SUN046 TaxID=3002440 RepID=UPI002DBD7E5D|nr:DNA alkylation repair protein [Flavobacterium sp. SUN046]MEC4048337.1 DNA alkylation repair protein [Flavobacterium sp. SUN046]
MSFIQDLEKDLRQNGDRDSAIPMAAYMKNNFSFLGIKTEARRAILKDHWKKNIDEIKANYRTIALELFKFKEREFHQCAIDILIKEIKNNYIIEDIKLIEFLLITQSWWDSVDTLAKYLLGNYLIHFPQEIHKTVNRFSNSSNMWLNRSAILFQLSYKQKTDFLLLQSLCEQHKVSNEFFIQKAIGWALREYSSCNPIGVLNYVEHTNLKPLSRKEAIRNITIK